MKKWFLILIPCLQLQAQTGSCILKEPASIINFGVGVAEEMNISASYNYQRVFRTCPTDGHYAYTPYTSDCFRGDWITLPEDHTPGDNLGNMLLVNASYRSGEFFNTMVGGLKPGAKYEFSVWMLNVCKPSEKCPFPLLPDITIHIKTPSGNVVSALKTGELQRYGKAQWTKYQVMFVMPTGINSLDITMINHSPGGCGNDFAIDDISFRECVVTPPPVTKKKPTPAPKTTGTVPNSTVKKATTPTVKKEVAVTTPPVKKQVQKPVAKTTQPVPAKQEKTIATVPKPVQGSNSTADSMQNPVKKPTRAPVYPPPAALVTRKNSTVKIIETGPGVIKIDLFDNGQIDGDTVSIYHNNKLIMSRVRLSDKPISFVINIDAGNPHHELVMVANNLGSIPPNTSLMYVTAGSKRYEVFISSNEQNNARVVFDLKE